MPVIVRQLASALLQVLRKLESNEAKNAREWARVYNDYAQPALAGPAIPTWTGAEISKMSPMIEMAMKVPSPSPSNFALALANGVEAFWLLPPIIFTPPGGTGAVTAFPGKPILIAGLTTVFSVPQPEEAAAESIAMQLDIATKTVLVTYTIPPAPPVISPIL